MKNIKDKASTKQARKVLQKQLKEKLIIQIETLVSEFGPDAIKAKKAIDKAAKNLAKTLAAKLSPEVSASPETPKVKKEKKAEVVPAENVTKAPVKITKSKKIKTTEPEKVV